MQSLGRRGKKEGKADIENPRVWVLLDRLNTVGGGVQVGNSPLESVVRLSEGLSQRFGASNWLMSQKRVLGLFFFFYFAKILYKVL